MNAGSTTKAAVESTTTPLISVVVATYNRAHLLGRLIEAFEAQEGSPPFEVVLVDNGSTDATASTLAALVDGTSLDLRVMRRLTNRGPAPARNLGWQAASADWVAFTDDDCVPQPGWLAGLWKVTESADIVQGKTQGNPAQAPDGWFSWAPEAGFERGFYETCNIAYRRAVLAAQGGFDERIHLTSPGGGRAKPATWGDDTELAIRAKGAGATSTFTGAAVVWHDLKPGRLRDRLADIPRRAGVVATVKQHPEVRQLYDSRWFLQSAHGSLLVALAGVALAAGRPRRPGAWAAAALLIRPWAKERGKWYPRRRWPQVLPQWFVVDVAEVAVLAAASVRERTLFL